MLAPRRQAASFDKLLAWPILTSLSFHLSIEDVQSLGHCSKTAYGHFQDEHSHLLDAFREELKQWFGQVDILHDILRPTGAILSGAPVHKFLLPSIAEVVRNVEICVREVDACSLFKYRRTQEQYEYVHGPPDWDFHCCRV